MTRFLFGTDIPDPTAVAYDVGDDGEYESDPLAPPEPYEIWEMQRLDHKASSHLVVVQIAGLFAFAVVLIVASLRSAGILHG